MSTLVPWVSLRRKMGYEVFFGVVSTILDESQIGEMRAALDGWESSRE